MNPRLLAGATFPLGSAALTVGRHVGSDIHVLDIAASRQHCAITPMDGRFVLRDLDSRHGTFVNGLPVRERTLEPGNRIQVGGSLFLFATEAVDGEPGAVAGLLAGTGVIALTLPPLRERREDIPLLASHFAARVSRDLGRPVAGFSPEARACLERYAWPGNVRWGFTPTTCTD